jgi:pimeloyl-ACP methyl ester carboxylesterase
MIRRGALPPVGSFIRLGTSSLFIDDRGDGPPAIVMLPGAGLTGLDYLPIHRRAAETNRSVVYDRAGTGWSDPIQMPRTALAVTDELRALLDSVGVQRVVLVGHSLGGLYARHFATRFPDRVGGLVLLDPAHEDYEDYMPPELAAKQASSRFFDVMNAVLDVALKTSITRAILQRVPTIRSYQRLYQELFAKEMADWPADLRDVLVERHGSLDWLASGLRESTRVDRLYREVRAAGPLPDLPLIILASVGTDAFQEVVSTDAVRRHARDEVDGRLRLYAALTEPLTRGEVRQMDAGHVTLPFRHPDAVIAAVRDVGA